MEQNIEQTTPLNTKTGGSGLLGDIDRRLPEVCHHQQPSPLEVVQRLLDFFTQGFWEPLIYIFLYAISPLILFPSTLLTLAAGFVFGLFLGISYTVIASNISFTVTF